MEQLFEVTTRYTYEELKRYNRFYRIRKVYPRLALFLLLMAALGVIVMIAGSAAIGWAVIVGLLFGIIISIIIRTVRLPKALKNIPMFDKAVTVRFFENRITAEYDNTRIEYDRARIKRVYETGSDFYIFVQSVGGIIIAKQNCSEQLSEYIRGLAPTKKE